MDCGGAGSRESKPKFVQAETATVLSKTEVPDPPPLLIKYSYQVKGEASLREGDVRVESQDQRAPFMPNDKVVVCYKEGDPKTSELLPPSHNCDGLKFKEK
jgi:hypothetical protein